MQQENVHSSLEEHFMYTYSIYIRNLVGAKRKCIQYGKLKTL